MRELQISDDEAQRLILMLKRVLKEHNQSLHEGASGEILITGSGNLKFVLNYRYTERKKSFNIRETKYNYNLLRINLNNSFHKNADNEKVIGNRINIFSTNEYHLKNDGTTYMRSFRLPYDSIRNTDDFHHLLKDLLSYTNINDTDKINIQDSLL